MLDKFQSRPVRTHTYISLEPSSAFTYAFLSHSCLPSGYAASFSSLRHLLNQIKLNSSGPFLRHHLQACYPPAPLKSRQLTQVIHISECDKNQPTHQTLLLYSNYRTKRIILIQESVSPKIRKDCLKSKQVKHRQSGPYHHLAIENVRS